MKAPAASPSVTAGVYGPLAGGRFPAELIAAPSLPIRPIANIGAMADVRAMRKWILLVAMALSGGCSEVDEGRYASWADADRAGVVERGWIPPFVPQSARDIHDVHDLDTNRQRLSFTIDPTAVRPMVEGLAPSTRLTGIAARRTFEEIGWNEGQAAGAEVYLHCARGYPGILAVDGRTGRAAFTSPAEWVEARCPKEG